MLLAELPSEKMQILNPRHIAMQDNSDNFRNASITSKANIKNVPFPMHAKSK